MQYPGYIIFIVDFTLELHILRHYAIVKGNGGVNRCFRHGSRRCRPMSYDIPCNGGNYGHSYRYDQNKLDWGVTVGLRCRSRSD